MIGEIKKKKKNGKREMGMVRKEWLYNNAKVVLRETSQITHNNNYFFWKKNHIKIKFKKKEKKKGKIFVWLGMIGNGIILFFKKINK